MRQMMINPILKLMVISSSLLRWLTIKLKLLRILRHWNPLILQLLLKGRGIASLVHDLGGSRGPI